LKFDKSEKESFRSVLILRSSNNVFSLKYKNMNTGLRLVIEIEIRLEFDQSRVSKFTTLEIGFLFSIYIIG